MGFEECKPTIDEQFSILLGREGILGVQLVIDVAYRNNPMLATLDWKDIDNEVLFHSDRWDAPPCDDASLCISYPYPLGSPAR